MQKRCDQEAWKKAAKRMKGLPGPIQVRALREEMVAHGVQMSDAIPRVVVAFLGENPSEDQVRDLAVTLSKTLGVKPERFVDLWQEGRLRD